MKECKSDRNTRNTRRQKLIVVQIIIFFIFCYVVVGIVIAYLVKWHKKVEPKLTFTPLNIQTQKLIIDVDTGADDAAAILFALLATERPEILAVTTVYGNTNRVQVDKNTWQTLEIINSKVPIYSGAYAPLLELRQMSSFFGKDGMGDIYSFGSESVPKIDQEHASLAMIRLIKKWPKQVSIVALGPLTNIALAIRLEPNFWDYVKDLFWTGGSIEGLGNIQPGIEFNAFVDPAANFVVFNTTKRPVIVAAWEFIYLHANITKQWRTDVLGKINNKVVRFLNQVEKCEMNGEDWPAADQKTMFIAMFPQFITKAEYYHLEAVYEGEHTKGLLLVDYMRNTGRPNNALLVFEIDVNQFQEQLFCAYSAKI